MNRREFILALGGVAVAWPLAARAQQPERMRRIRRLAPTAPDHAEAQTRFAALRQGLQRFGWIEGRNLQIDARWGAGDAGAIASAATEPNRADRICERARPRRLWVCRKPGSARRQRH